MSLNGVINIKIKICIVAVYNCIYFLFYFDFFIDLFYLFLCFLFLKFINRYYRNNK